MISHKHKCIFIHIPKAAGTSIETVFLDDLGLDFEDKHALILGKTTNKYLLPKTLSHLTATQLIEQHYISEELFKKYYKFSAVRHPLDRLFSTYKYLAYNSVISFDVFIKKIFPKLVLTDEKNFLETQTNFLYKNNRNLMDFICKFENLNTDFQKVSSHLNINIPLKHKNKSKRKWAMLRGIKIILLNPKLISYLNFSKDKKRTVSEEARSIVLNHYKDDFKNFSYEL